MENKKNYAEKIIDGKLYSIVENEHLDDKAIYVLAPYTIDEHTEESLRRYDEFMCEYEDKHRYCPKCGHDDHTSTLVGYILDWGKKDEYKDMNRCVCIKCGDKHSKHDRV